MGKILISIDHKWRDVPGYVYAGLMLEKLGHEVHFVRNGLEKYFVPTVKPDLVLMIHLYDKRKQKFAKELKKQGILVALMPTEGIPTLEKYRAFAAGVDTDLSGVDVHFVWNRPMQEILRRNHTISDVNIYTVGVPRFDFYREPLSKVLLCKEEFCIKYNLNPEYPIITFATNFTQASFYNKNREFLEQDSRNLGYKKVMEKISGGVMEVARRDNESREILTSSFIRLMNEFPHVNFILKLHPSEDHQFYYDRFNNIKSGHHDRLRIITQEHIWDILNVTDIEMKRSCTTGIEAWILGKPTIEMKLNPDEWYFSKEHASGSDVVESYDELRDIVEHYLSGGEIDEDKHVAREKFIRRWCYQVDGKSTERMVQIIDNVLKKRDKCTKPRFSLKNILIYYGLIISNYMIHDIRVYGLGNYLTKNKVDKLGRLDKYFNLDDINYWKTKLSSLSSTDL